MNLKIVIRHVSCVRLSTGVVLCVVHVSESHMKVDKKHNLPEGEIQRDNPVFFEPNKILATLRARLLSLAVLIHLYVAPVSLVHNFSLTILFFC